MKEDTSLVFPIESEFLVTPKPKPTPLSGFKNVLITLLVILNTRWLYRLRWIPDRSVIY